MGDPAEGGAHDKVRIAFRGCGPDGQFVGGAHLRDEIRQMRPVVDAPPGVIEIRRVGKRRARAEDESLIQVEDQQRRAHAETRRRSDNQILADKPRGGEG